MKIKGKQVKPTVENCSILFEYIDPVTGYPDVESFKRLLDSDDAEILATYSLDKEDFKVLPKLFKEWTKTQDIWKKHTIWKNQIENFFKQIDFSTCEEYEMLYELSVDCIKELYDNRRTRL